MGQENEGAIQSDPSCISALFCSERVATCRRNTTKELAKKKSSWTVSQTKWRRRSTADDLARFQQEEMDLLDSFLFGPPMAPPPSIESLDAATSPSELISSAIFSMGAPLIASFDPTHSYAASRYCALVSRAWPG